MLTIQKNHRVLTFSKDHVPAAKCQSGEIVAFETIDCFNGLFHSEEQTLDIIDGSYLNPATGPLFIEGAEPGDLLKIEVLAIETEDFGIMTADKYDGLLDDICTEERVRIIPIESGEACLHNGLKLKLDPMIGVIGVAPEKGAIDTVLSGIYGGNMDCKAIRAGAILYLPVFVSGALLVMGDLHAIMGDGESGGCGLEVSGRVEVKVTVVKNETLPVPLLMSEGKVMTIVTEPTIEMANKQAIRNMHHFLTKQVGIDLYEAKYILSLAGDLKVCQIVDHEKTARMEVSLDVLEHFGYKLP